jgi:hypothetical protein
MTFRTEQSAGELRARIRTREGETFDGMLIEASPSAVVLDFPLSQKPALPIAAEVLLFFSGSPLGGSIATSGRVVYRGEDEHRSRYRFQIDREQGTALSTLFNRRGAYRVCPRPDSPVAVMLEVPGGSRLVEATLNDLSRTGLSVLIRDEDEGALFTAQRLRMRFSLERGDEGFVLWGIVRYRRLEGAAIRYGFEFDSREAAHFDRIQQRLNDFVMKRQRELLRSMKSAQETS